MYGYGNTHNLYNIFVIVCETFDWWCHISKITQFDMLHNTTLFYLFFTLSLSLVS